MSGKVTSPQAFPQCFVKKKLINLVSRYEFFLLKWKKKATKHVNIKKKKKPPTERKKEILLGRIITSVVV